MFQILQERSLNNSLIDVKELFLSAEKYSPSESTITFKLTADGWEQHKIMEWQIQDFPDKGAPAPKFGAKTYYLVRLLL